MTTLQFLKRSVIKEELVALTGDFMKALILNQFLYWSERVDDFDSFIEEEKERCQNDGQEISIHPTEGWIYKSAEELAQETMLGKSPSSMRLQMMYLVDQQWLLERTNPYHKWDRTKQYRVNIPKIQRDLENLGYPLERYQLAFSKTETPFSKIKNAFSKFENRNLQNQKALPESTTKITKEDEEDNARASNFQNEENNLASDTHNPRGEIYNPAVFQNLAWEGLAWEGQEVSQPISQAHRLCTPTSTDLDQPVLDGQAASMSPTAPTDDIYQLVDRRMTMHLGRLYIAKQGDYRAIVDLRAAGVPGEFILNGIDYTFTNFADKHPRSFSYCAEIIKQRWALEQEKHAPPTPVETQSPTPRRLSRRNQPSTPTLVSQGSAGSTANGGHDKRYGAFYELFPDS